MKKPSNYDEYQLGGGKRLPAGGYICKIMQVEETKSKAGKEMVTISLDIAEGEYKGLYAEKYKNNTNVNKKWGCIVYALTEGEYINTFLGFCKSVEASNGVGINWGDNFGAQFKGKTVGAVFGEEEFQGNNGVATAVKVRFFLPTEDIKNNNFTVPEKKCLQPQPTTDTNGFFPATDVGDDDLPF